MYDETPNQQEIDWFEERMEEIYQYDKLKECNIEYLKSQKYLIENREIIFKSSFPAEDSLIQGETRAFMSDNKNDTKESLTNAERLRIQWIKQEAKREVHRAIGHRRQLKRRHRHKLANSIADLVTGLGNLTPW